MVGEGARAKIPKQVTFTDPKGTLSDVPTNPFADVASVIFKTPTKHESTSEQGRATRRACDNMAAERHMSEQESMIQVLTNQLNDTKEQLAKPREPAINWLNVSHGVSVVAVLMPRSAQKLDQTMARVVFDVCPSFAHYKITSQDGLALGKALVETHSRNLDEFVPNDAVIAVHKEFRYMGVLYATSGPWTLLGRFHTTIARRTGSVLLINEDESDAVIRATFVPPDEWNTASDSSIVV